MSFWFAVLCFHLFLQVKYWKQNHNSRKLEIIYHALCWGLPSIPVIINFAADNFFYPELNTACFVGNKFNNWLEYLSFYVPYSLAMIAIIFFAALSVYYLIVGLERPRWRAHIRLMFFIVWVICVCMLVAAIRFYMAAEQSKFDASLASWQECKIYKNLGAQTNATCATDYPPERMNLPVYTIDLVLGVGIGVFGFTAYGFDSVNINFWKDLVYFCICRDLLSLKILLSVPGINSTHIQQQTNILYQHSL